MACSIALFGTNKETSLLGSLSISTRSVAVEYRLKRRSIRVKQTGHDTFYTYIYIYMYTSLDERSMRLRQIGDIN